MSARDDMDVFLNCQGLSVIDRQKAQWLMSDFAHELAEQQREHLETAECEHGGLYSPDVPWGLPDLIDPEVEK